jgi:hypothetical protein
MGVSDHRYKPYHRQRQGVQEIVQRWPSSSYSSHCTIIPLEGYEPVRVLAQDGHGTTLRLTKDLLPPGKKPPIYWIFESGFISDLPWDPRDWHWQSTRNMGDTPFFGYSSKRGYQNARKKHLSPSIITFI